MVTPLRLLVGVEQASPQVGPPGLEKFAREFNITPGIRSYTTALHEQNHMLDSVTVAVCRLSLWYIPVYQWDYDLTGRRYGRW